MKFIYHDGGRKAAGFKGSTGDCVARAIAIAADLPYQEVYDALAEGNQGQRKTKGNRRHSGRRTARAGIYTRRKWFKDYMRSLGFAWTPTMLIGSGCKVHLADGELPSGRLIVMVSKHCTAVIDGVIYDTYDPQREPIEIFSGEIEVDEDGQRRNKVVGVTGGRCVYGYWRKA